MFGLKGFKTIAATAALVVASWAGAASAATVTTGDVGTSWTVDFTCSVDAGCSGVTEQAVFTLTGVASTATQTVWSMSMVLTNTSSTSNFLTAIGFNTDPDAVMSNVSGSGTIWDGGAGSIPSTTTELCVWDGNNCSAGNNHYLGTGASDTVTFDLTTALSTSLSFDNYAVKAVSVAGGPSYEFGGTEVPPVPLPATGILLIGALGGLGLAKRRWRKAA